MAIRAPDGANNRQGWPIMIVLGSDKNRPLYECSTEYLTPKKVGFMSKISIIFLRFSCKIFFPRILCCEKVKLCFDMMIFDNLALNCIV